MKEFEVAYIPIGVPTFHLESAQKLFEESCKMLHKICKNVSIPSEMLLSIDSLRSFCDEVEPDIIIMQNITFANAQYASEILSRFDCPILLWTLREPVIDGGRLRLNSLTGAYSAANAIRSFRKGEFEYIFGSPNEDGVEEEIRAVIRAAEIKKSLSSLKLAAIGHTPQGFGFGRALDSDLLKTFGVVLESIETRELIERAKSFQDEECTEFMEQAKESMRGLAGTPKKNQSDFTRLYKAYYEYVKDNQIGALASRCWPDFFTAYGTPVCAVLAMLNDAMIASSCEADVYGALSMYIGMELTKTPAFFGDPVSMDENENTITYWHCGTAACSLAREEEGACVGVHPNRKIGPTMEFGCKPCKDVTVFRIGQDADKNFRFFIMKGEAIDKPKQFCGTSIVVQSDHNAKEIIYQSVKAGFEPHFAVIYGDITRELQILAHMLGIVPCMY